MHCERCQVELEDFLDGELSAPRGAAVREHLAACEACRGLREAMDRLFNESMVRPNGGNGRTAGGPAYDLYETEDGLTFRFSVPGMRAEDVEITSNQGTLTVKGSYPHQEEQPGWTWQSFCFICKRRKQPCLNWIRLPLRTGKEITICCAPRFSIRWATRKRRSTR